MSSSRHESSSRTWWPLSSRPSTSSTLDKVLCRPTLEKPQKQSGVKFNTFASAIGFKTKKHPSLNIHEPSVGKQVKSYREEQEPPRYANRPPSRSVSSTLRSSFEPCTPSDGPRDPLPFRQLTHSDDPFASRGSSTIPDTQDPALLSVYCNFSVADDPSKKQEAVAVVTAEDSSSCSENQSVRRKKPSDASLGRQGKDVAGGGLTISKSKSSSTFVAASRLSSLDPISPARPYMRARGMTDTEPRPKFLQHNHAPSDHFSHFSPPPSPSLSCKPSRPRVLVRQSSSSRIGLPPSAPPKHDLPHPPGRPVGHHSSVILPEDVVKILSSGVSLASIYSDKDVPRPQRYRNTYASKANDHISLYSTDMDQGRGSSTSARIDTASLTLKKAVSHQSLAKRGCLPDSKSIPTPSPEGSDKLLRKQRSFHHQWLPMPSIPSTTATADTAAMESRRGYTSGQSAMGRKRLFSGPSQRRPSTSQPQSSVVVDDDVRSVFSLPVQSDRVKAASLSNALTLSTASARSSFWDEGPGAVDSPISPTSTRDYTPQQILSPADILRVEASLQDEQSFYNYSHSLSHETSISTSMSDTLINDYSPGGGLSPPSLKHGTPERAGIFKPGRSLRTRSCSTKTQELDARPSTSQSQMTPPGSPCITPSPSSPCQSGPFSLPPPPRRRPQPRPPSTHSTQPDLSSFVPITPLSPPPFRRKLPMKAPGEVVGKRQSLMRKPSFLEIEDDTEINVGKTSVESFLDLNRESLDIVRSVEYSDDD